MVSWLLGRGSAKLFGLAPDTANAHTLSNMYSNTTFLGIPLMTALYPQGIFCIPIYSLTCNVVLYTVSTGLYMKDSSKKKAGAGEVLRRLTNIPIFPASHYITPKEKTTKRAVKEIRRECDERVAYFKSVDKAA